MKIRIDDIKVNHNTRIRQNNGDISPLMKSMTKYGLLQPIIIDSSYNLLAGYRRLQAARKLGWSIIEVKIVEAKTKLEKTEIEIYENNTRKDFTYDEIEEGMRRIKKYSKPKFYKGIINFFKKLFKK